MRIPPIYLALVVMLALPVAAGAAEPPPGFTTAAAGGDVQLVRQLLAENPDAELKGAAGRRALLHAAGVGNAEMLEVLLDRGADANTRAKDAIARTPLMLAAAGGHLEAIDILISRGAKLDTRDRGGKTALAWATLQGRTGAVERLLDKGADVNARDNGKVTPVLLAVGRADDATLRVLAERGADLEAESQQNKMTPLLLAIERGGVDTVAYLLERGAKADGAEQRGAHPLDERRRQRPTGDPGPAAGPRGGREREAEGRLDAPDVRRGGEARRHREDAPGAGRGRFRGQRRWGERPLAGRPRRRCRPGRGPDRGGGGV